jgi:hypothetical protein
MDGNAYIGELISAIFFIIVGSRLLVLSRRTHESPEFLLGGAFVTSGVGLLLYMVPYIEAFESLWTPFVFAGRVAFIPVSIWIAMFTRCVFRPTESWATWLVWCIPAIHVIGVCGSAATGDWEGFYVGNGWFWLEWTGYTLPVAWSGFEALSSYGPARRRQRLGLCDPIVSNRILLWGLFGVLQVCLSGVVVFQYEAFEEAEVFTEGWDRIYGAVSITSVVMILLAFFPPAFYRRWIEAGVAPSASGNQ